MIIKPSTALRNDYLSISNMARDTEEPIYITKNGEGDLVVMNIDAFERREQLIQLKMNLRLAEQSKRAGEQTYSVEEVRQELKEIYGNADLQN
jgi:prevent-host-death family protein